MKIVNPNNALFDVYVIPRYYNIDNTHTVEWYREDTDVTATINPLFRTLENGYILYTFAKSEFEVPFNIAENQTYSFKITDSTTTNIIFRGKMFTTSQVTQQYKINNG